MEQGLGTDGVPGGSKSFQGADGKDELPFDVRQPRYNVEMEAAMREARDIMRGKAKADSFDSAAAMFAALDE